MRVLLYWCKSSYQLRIRSHFGKCPTPGLALAGNAPPWESASWQMSDKCPGGGMDRIRIDRDIMEAREDVRVRKREKLFKHTSCGRSCVFDSCFEFRTSLKTRKENCLCFLCNRLFWKLFSVSIEICIMVTTRVFSCSLFH